MKVTAALTNILLEDYKLQDHRGDDKYEKWDLNSQYLQDKSIRFNLSPQVDFNTYASALGLLDDRYFTIISASGDYMYFPEVYGSGYSECIETLNGEIHMDSENNRFIIDNKIYQLPDDGIGVMVYDMKLGYLVDLGMVDIYNVGNIVQHVDLGGI